MSATARVTATPPASRTSTPRTSPARSRRRALKEVAPPAPSVAGNGMFALIVTGLLVLGMLGLLVLNTTLAQGAFEIGSLTQVKRDLAVNEQRLLQTVAHAEAPESLQQRADALGMVPAQAPVFLRLADRTVLGRPTPAKALPRRASGAAAAARTPSVSDAAVPGGTRDVTPPTAAGKGGVAASTTDEARPDAPTGPSTTDEARPDSPTGPNTTDEARPDSPTGPSTTDEARPDAPTGVQQP
jgi:hypothetical protein